MNINDFKATLGVKELPSELENLIEFNFQLPDNQCYYSQGFEIDPFGRAGLETWSTEEDFLNRLIPFASANGSGSIYTIWIDDSNQSLSEMPIVVFGDEGGVHIVAENILQLLHLLTYDIEITIDWNEIKFVKVKGIYEESKNLGKYLKWIKENYDLAQIEEPEKTIKTAQDKYKSEFDNWFSKYYKQ
jgi:hypothetical protein